ncbi:hypothetical protein LTS12_027686 [Elasticomyces elasticus]|nr:hypothetical protein LTS12_027686 [Elasticomyces elasticus]
MKFSQRFFGPSPEPLPGEGNKAVVNAASRSNNLVFMDDPFETPRNETVKELACRVDLYGPDVV